MWDLIVSVPDHCLSFYFDHNFLKSRNKCHFATMHYLCITNHLFSNY